MRVLLAALLAALLLAPAAVADHPGSNQGLRAFATPLDPLGLDAMVHRLPDVQQDFADWEASYPQYVSRFVMGETGSGFPLEGVLVTDEGVPYDQARLATGTKLRVYLDGGHHGNEFLGVELAMYYIERLLDQAASGDPAVVQFLKDTEVYAVPIINVDGNFLDTRKNSAQVDPNRNYDFQFGGPGSGSSVTDLNYRGPRAGSEAEVRANMEFGRQIYPDVWVTMHTGVAEFYWPWGWTHDKSPDDWFFSRLEAPFENATNGRVDAMMAAELYLAAGATDDWAYGVLGIPGHTFEVHEDQFIPVYGEGIPDVIADQLRGLDFVVKNVKVWGAWLEATPTPEGLRIDNLGWNNATGVKLDGEPLADIPAGASVTVPWDGEADLAYKQMVIETSKVRTIHVASTDATPAPQEKALPGAGLLLAALAVAAALVVAVRRR